MLFYTINYVSEKPVYWAEFCSGKQSQYLSVTSKRIKWQSLETYHNQHDHYIYHLECIVYEFDPVDLDTFMYIVAKDWSLYFQRLSDQKTFPCFDFVT